MDCGELVESHEVPLTNGYFSIESQLPEGEDRADIVIGVTPFVSLGWYVERDDPEDSDIVIFDEQQLQELCDEECPEIYGNLHIASIAGLEDLRALEGLRRVHGTLSISDNPDLKSLHGLEDLERVGGLEMFTNLKLENLEGLESLNRLDGVSTIEGNVALESLDGLENLEHAYVLQVRYNPTLERLTTFDSLVSLGRLDIEHHNMLTDLGTFPKVQRIDDQIYITNNPALAALDSFNQVKTIGGRLAIEGNSGLQQISGFQKLETVERLRISNNEKLPKCEAQRLAEQVESLEYEPYVGNNGGGC